MQLNYGSLNEYFTFQNQFTYQTLFDGVYMLPQANTVRINSASSEVQHHSWWDYDFSQTDEKLSFEDACNETKRLFSGSVTRQMGCRRAIGELFVGWHGFCLIAVIASGNVEAAVHFYLWIRHE